MRHRTYRYRGRWNRRGRNAIKMEIRHGYPFADVRTPSPERWARAAVTLVWRESWLFDYLRGVA